MPSDTARENASIAYSIVTDCTNERRNFDGPDSSRLGVNEDTNRSIAEELTVSSPPIGISSVIENDSSCLGVIEGPSRSIAEELTVLSPPIGISSSIEKGKPYSIRYFVIKSLNHENIQLSVNRGIWATQAMNEAILDEAFHELPPDIGEALCELLDGQDALDVDLKMDIFARNDLSSKRPYVEPSLHLGYQDFNASLIPNGTMFYPSLLYQHQIDASRLHVAPQRINGLFSAEESAFATGESKSRQSRQSRHSQRNRCLANLHVDTDMGPQINMWGLPAERSPLASNLTEDDILEMTYEEYLEAYSRGSKRSPHPVSGPSRSTQRSLASEENCDDSQSGCSSKKRRSH
ncbi:uncharacterized protein LOC125841470 isoform X8 [Solanum stenotomum]|uniref:uncharacterized protein LOC125841470 isoform X8 n=1 Tax=Solanum stenotomum TaxID=172797 RepID=UPI0020CFF7DE|nr:uncharacterized protein LOC125841470 isoform X8 [Solanum stenotomum]